jgi:hypothetical protein
MAGILVNVDSGEVPGRTQEGKIVPFLRFFFSNFIFLHQSQKRIQRRNKPWSIGMNTTSTDTILPSLTTHSRRFSWISLEKMEKYGSRRQVERTSMKEIQIVTQLFELDLTMPSRVLEVVQHSSNSPLDLRRIP